MPNFSRCSEIYTRQTGEGRQKPQVRPNRKDNIEKNEEEEENHWHEAGNRRVYKDGKKIKPTTEKKWNRTTSALENLRPGTAEPKNAELGPHQNFKAGDAASIKHNQKPKSTTEAAWTQQRLELRSRVPRMQFKGACKRNHFNGRYYHFVCYHNLQKLVANEYLRIPLGL